MKLKISLHNHIDLDLEDRINYSFEDLLKFNNKLNYKFDAIALTMHNKILNSETLDYYDRLCKENDVLFISGVEKTLLKYHFLILNIKDQSFADINTIEDLRNFKQQHPEILIGIAHPFFRVFDTKNTIIKFLDQIVDIIDFVELSWFFTKRINLNKSTIKYAQKYHKSLVATSDTHILSFLNNSFVIVNAKEKSIQSIFEAIKQNKIQNKQKKLSLFEFFKIPILYISKLKFL